MVNDAYFPDDKTKDWDIEPSYTILWPSGFQSIKTMTRYAAYASLNGVVACSLGSFSISESSPKPTFHVFGEHNQGSEMRPHTYFWNARVAENTDAYLMLRWLQQNDEYFDVTIGAWDAEGNYIGVWANGTETLIGCLVEGRGSRYFVRSLPFSDFRGNFKRIENAIDETNGGQYGDGRARAAVSADILPWVKFAT